MTYQEPLKLYRAKISTYQARDYASREREALSHLGVEVVSSLKEADILITNTQTYLEDFPRHELEKLKLIIHPNSGYDHFQANLVSSIQAPIVLGNILRAKPVAAYALAAFYDYLGALPKHDNWDQARAFKRHSIEKLHIGLIGYGPVGTLLAQSLQSLVASVRIKDPYKKLNDDFSQCQVIVLACSLNQNNVGMINADFFNQHHNLQCLINPARGKLIDEAALIDWLQNNQERKAYLDVFVDEPADFTRFPQNCYCSSHIAGVDDQLDQRMIEFIISVLADFKSDHNHFRQRWQDQFLQNRIHHGEFI